MIDGNVLKFGYGDIAVSSNIWTHEMKFQEIEPPLECGDRVPDDWGEIGRNVTITLNFDDYVNLSKLISKVKNKELSIFEFKGYVFDFSKYDEKSIAVVEKRCDNCGSLLLLSAAC